MRDINGLQLIIMQFISEWIREEKKPIPQKVVISNFITQGYPERTAEEAVKTLARKGYLRKAASVTRSACYVQLRGI